MKRLSLALFVLAIAMLLASSCNKPDSFGADLLDNDKLDTGILDTFSIVATTSNSDSLIAYDFDRGSEYSNFLCGSMEDPIFGTVSSTIYTKIGASSSTPHWVGIHPDSFLIDSMVLMLEYSSLNGVRGDITGLRNLKVREISTQLTESGEIYYTNQSFETGAALLVDQPDFLPMPLDSVDVTNALDPDNIQIDRLAPHLRLRIEDQDFINKIINEDLYFETDSSGQIEINTSAFFNENFGIQIESDLESRSMLNFTLATSNSRIRFYYRIINPSTAANPISNFEYNYVFPSNLVKTVNLEHNYSGSVIEPFIDNTSMGDSLLFLQSAAGTKIKVDFPYIDNLENLFINKAELELTVVESVEGVADFEYDLFPPVNRIIASFVDDDGELKTVRDFSVNDTNFSQGFLEAETIETGEIVRSYKINITGQVQDMIKGEVAKTIYLTPLFSGENITRSILYGPGSTKNRAKLNIRYTNL